MKIRSSVALLAAGTATTLGLVGCSSSASSNDPKAPYSCDTQCQSDINAACDGSCTAGPSGAEALPSKPDDLNITRAYATATDFNEGGEAVLDTLTCPQWLRLSGDVRQNAASYYLLKYGDKTGFQDDAPSVTKLITTSCKSYGSGETPHHIVKVLVKATNGH